MASDRRYVLTGLLLLLAVVTTVMLMDVLGTVFFAVTVTYVLTPVYRRFRRRGLHPWWASAATSTVAILGLLAVLAPIVVLLGLRVSQVIDLVETFPIPQEVTLTLFGYSIPVESGDVTPFVINYLESTAASVASAAPVLGIKFTLFAIVVFSLLMSQGRARRALMAVVPPEYHDVAAALDERARTTLFAIYVVQAATALGTFLVAIPVFYVLGYGYPVTLATIAGVLQFLPIIGPSVLIGLLAAFDFAVGNLVRGVLVVFVAGVIVAWLPDPLIRPRLARRTASFPGSLYFIGFTGGLFSLGVVGIIAGPLIIALLVESVSLLADEMNHGAGALSPTPDGDEETETSASLVDRIPSPFDDPEKPTYEGMADWPLTDRDDAAGAPGDEERIDDRDGEAEAGGDGSGTGDPDGAGGDESETDDPDGDDAGNDDPDDEDAGSHARDEEPS